MTVAGFTKNFRVILSAWQVIDDRGIESEQAGAAFIEAGAIPLEIGAGQTETEGECLTLVRLREAELSAFNAILSKLLQG